MTQQLDFFREPAPIIEQPVFITQDNALLLVPPSVHPTGAEGSERKAARLRELDDRKAAKTFENILNSNQGGASRWRVTA